MKTTGKAFIILLMALLAGFILLPFIPLLLWSVTKQWPWPLLFPESLQLETWKYLFSKSGRAWEGLFNSVVIAFITLSLNIVLGIPAAKVVAYRNFFGKSFILIVLVAPLFIPFTASVMGLHTVAIKLQFINDYIGVSISHVLVTLPYFFVIHLFQFQRMGGELQEAAQSLGANKWQTFKWVELPRLLPATFVASLLVIIISFSQYLPTWIMSGGTLLTLPLIMFPYASSGDSSVVAAYSLWFFVPIIMLLIVYYILHRVFIRKG